MSDSIEVCFILESEEFRISGSKLKKNSNYFEDLINSSQDFSEIRLILPDWIKSRPFKVYLSYVETTRIPKLDLITAQKLLWLGDFFKDSFLQTTLITSHILPYLNKETVLLFVQDTCTKLSNSSEILSCWSDLFRESCKLAAENIKYLLKEAFPVFSKLEKIALKEIFEHTARLDMFSEIYPKFQEIKQCRDLTDLLSILEFESLNEFQKSSNRLMVFEWVIDDFEPGNFYKESEVFKIGQSDWVSFISCFDHESRIEVSMKPAEVTEKIKKKVSVITCSAVFQDELVDEIEAQIFPVSAYSENPPIVREVNASRFESLRRLAIKFYASSEDVISETLAEIIGNPEMLAGNSQRVSKKFMLSILGSKYLNVRDEDQALEILAEWVESQDLQMEAVFLKTLNDCIFWENVSVKKLVSVSFNYQKFKLIGVFQNSIKKALENKGKKPGKEEPEGRKSYKKTIVRENYTNPKDYFNVLFDLILNTQTGFKVKASQTPCFQQPNHIEEKAREELPVQDVVVESISPISHVKNSEHETSKILTPVNRGQNFHSRHSSQDDVSVNTLTGARRLRNAGAVIGDLVHKLKSSRRQR